MNEKTITTPDILRFLDVPYTRLAYWFKKKIFSYDASAPGAGVIRHFTLDDVILIKSTILILEHFKKNTHDLAKSFSAAMKQKLSDRDDTQREFIRNSYVIFYKDKFMWVRLPKTHEELAEYLRRYEPGPITFLSIHKIVEDASILFQKSVGANNQE